MALKFYSKAAKTARPEARLQKTLVQLLLLSGNPDVIWHSIPNEGKRSVVGGAELKAMGLRSGVADLIFIVDRIAHYLELKAPGTNLDKARSENQIAFGNDCRACGVSYAVANNIDDAIQILNSWGVLRQIKRSA